MRKLLILTYLCAGMAWSQTTPSSLLITRIFNITNTWPGECAAGVIDNRSMFTRQNNYHSFFATGTGTWSVTMEFSDVSCAGPFTSYGPQAVINQASNPAIGYGTDGISYHQFITFVFAGANANTVQVTYSAVQNFFLSTSTGSLSFPLNVAQGGTGFGSCTLNGFIFGNGASALQCLAAGSQYQVAQAGASGVPTMGALQLAQAAAVSGQLGVPNGGTGDSTLTLNGMLFGNGTSPAGATAAGSQYQVFQAGASGVPTVGALQLAQAAAITGNLPSTNGGTGAASPTAHTVAVAEGASPFNFSGPGTLGQIFTSNGPGSDPTFQAAAAPIPGAGLPAGTGNQVLQIQPNITNNTTLQWVGKQLNVAADYNFPALSCNNSNVCAPGGASGASLPTGNNSMTFTPVPLGVNGSDGATHGFWVSGGVGAAEVCTINGGSGTSGQASGTIIINCANTHSGAFTISSVAGGLPEAEIIAGGNNAPILVSTAISANGTTTLTNSGTLMCSPGATITWTGAAASSVVVVAASNVVVRDCSFTSGTAGNTFKDSGSLTNIRLENNIISGGVIGISFPTSTHVIIQGNRISGMTNAGIAMQQSTNISYVSIIGNDIDSTGCTVLNCGGISLYNCSHCVVANNRVTIGGNQDGGIFLGENPGATQTHGDDTVTGNTVKGNGNNTYECGALGGTNLIHSNNTCDFTGQATNPHIGWEFGAISNSAISNDHFFGTGSGSTTGVYLESTNNVSVTGGTVTGVAAGGKCVFLQNTNASLGLSNNRVTGVNCVNTLGAPGAGGDIQLDTLVTGTVANNVFEDNSVLGNTTAGHYCMWVANAASATESNTIFKGNTLTNCAQGLNVNTSATVSVENNTCVSCTAVINVNTNTPRIIDTNGGTATAVAGAATLNLMIGTVTSESLVTAIGSIYTLTLADNLLTANSTVLANAFLGTSTNGTPQVVSATPTANQVVIKVKNIDAANAFNGTIKIQYQASNN